ncbi:DnaJ-domain-containing protein [Meredithblackwellia eburnea MCA 4105]
MSSSFGEFDLYEALGITNTATEQEIKKAYRQQALRHHPDKVAQDATEQQRQHANDNFQKIGFAYAVLSDDLRRRRYDETGKTEELFEGAKTEAEWKDYFKQLWKGEVSASTIQEFTKKYQGSSDEERDDILSIYTSSSGSLETLLTTLMCSTEADEPRIVKIVNDAIKSKQLAEFPRWKKDVKDTKARDKRREKAGKEAKEAEEYAKELGVHDKLFGGDGGDGKGKGKGKKKEGGDEDALRALIQGNQARRMENLFESLEAKYGATDKKGKKGKKRASTSNEDGEDDEPVKGKGKKAKVVEEEPSEEEFARIQAEMEKRRKGNVAEKEKEKTKGKKSKA